MKRYVLLNENNFIISTTDINYPQKNQDIFEFPDDFDFSNQEKYKVINGELVFCGEEQAETAEREYWADISYDDAVNAEIRKQYSDSAEFAILRQKEEKPEEYAKYYAYCEQCKAYVKEKFSQYGRTI